MICKCGGVLDVIRVEEPPAYLSEEEKLVYNRLCDVQCLKCGYVLYSQPYDFGSTLNPVRKIGNKDL